MTAKMIGPRYNGVIGESLTRDEGIALTIELGRAHTGDDYHNADVFGSVLHNGGDSYLEAERDRNPEAFAARVDEQVDRIQEIIAPHIGKWAAAKHMRLGVLNEGEWELWERLFGRSKVMHTSGIILGAAGLVMERTMIFDYDHPGDVSEAHELRWKGKSFKIGILLDTTEAEPSFCYGVEAPDVNRMLVPVRGFPRHRESFNGLWSWQLSGRTYQPRG